MAKEILHAHIIAASLPLGNDCPKAIAINAATTRKKTSIHLRAISSLWNNRADLHIQMSV